MPSHPVTEMRYNPDHDPGFPGALPQASVPATAMDFLAGIRVVGDARVLPGFVEMYDRHGRLVSTVRMVYRPAVQ